MKIFLGFLGVCLVVGGVLYAVTRETDKGK